MGRVVIKHGVGLADQFATGVVPQDLAALPGTEEPIEHKGPMLMLGPDSVIAWTGANNPGYGDPLTRATEAVARDVGNGWLDPAGATRVYAVAWTAAGAVDPEATRRLRAERLAARLAAAAPPGSAPRLAGGDTELRPVGGGLGLLIEDGRPAEWVSLPGQVRLGAASGDYRSSCAVLQTPVNELAPEFATRPGRPGAAILFREYLCPVSGVRLATELIRDGDDPAGDMVLAG
jgi:N-methylhydantoinase B